MEMNELFTNINFEQEQTKMAFGFLKISKNIRFKCTIMSEWGNLLLNVKIYEYLSRLDKLPFNPRLN